MTTLLTVLKKYFQIGETLVYKAMSRTLAPPIATAPFFQPLVLQLISNSQLSLLVEESHSPTFKGRK